MSVCMRVHVCAAWVSQGTPKACTCVLVCLCVRVHAYVGCVPNRGVELPSKDKLAALAAHTATQAPEG